MTVENGAAINGRHHATKKRHTKKTQPTPLWAYALLILFVAITIVTRPDSLHLHGEASIRQVFFYGWLTAISTGLGVVPFLCLPKVETYWVGISNGE
jgi:zinc transporter, ZIP family